MRTPCFNGHPGGGGLPRRGVCPVGVCPGGICPGDVHTPDPEADTKLDPQADTPRTHIQKPPAHCMLGYTPPPACGHKEWHTLLKILPCLKLHLQVVIIFEHHF